jgi:hypothetical protein
VSIQWGVDPIVTMEPLATPKTIIPARADSTDPVLSKLLSDFRIVMRDFVRALFGLPYATSEEKKQ